VAQRTKGGSADERWLNGSGPSYDAVAPGSNPTPPPADGKLCPSLDGLPPDMTQHRVLSAKRPR
jgi:hypothetical protein